LVFRPAVGSMVRQHPSSKRGNFRGNSSIAGGVTPPRRSRTLRSATRSRVRNPGRCSMARACTSGSRPRAASGGGSGMRSGARRSCSRWARIRTWASPRRALAATVRASCWPTTSIPACIARPPSHAGRARGEQLRGDRA